MLQYCNEVFIKADKYQSHKTHQAELQNASGEATNASGGEKGGFCYGNE
jgi:hypothetical protein